LALAFTTGKTTIYIPACLEDDLNSINPEYAVQGDEQNFTGWVTGFYSFTDPFSDPPDKLVEIGFYEYSHACFPNIRKITGMKGYTLRSSLWNADQNASNTSFTDSCGTNFFDIDTLDIDTEFAKIN
jgi:hypothetical protein